MLEDILEPNETIIYRQAESDFEYLGDNFDTALLNGALIEAIRFQKGEPDVVAMYEKQYALSIGLLKNSVDGKLRQDSYRSGQYRTDVG